MTEAGDPPETPTDGDAEPPANLVRVDFKRAQRTAPSDPTAPQKYGVFSRFIERGKVMVTLDSRRAGVHVPSKFAGEQQLNLDFSERFGLADFVYDERGVRASLSFNRQPFFCDVPWAAVYALYSHVDSERLTWPRSLPTEILDQLPEASLEHLDRVLELQIERLLRSAREHMERQLQEAKPASSPLDVVPDEPAAPSGEASSTSDDAASDKPHDDKPPPPPRGPGLRLVKS